MYMVMAVVIGGLYTTGLYMMLQRSIVKLIFGLVLIGHAANVMIFTTGGLVRARPPLIEIGATQPAPGYADPVPQALVLTAIVIGFAVLAFAAVLVQQVCETVGAEDADDMRGADT